MTAWSPTSPALVVDLDGTLTIEGSAKRYEDVLNAETLPVIVEWLKRNAVPFDEIHVGKPWCGAGGFYIDDRAIRPSEFRSLDRDAIADILDREKRG